MTYDIITDLIAFLAIVIPVGFVIKKVFFPSKKISKKTAEIEALRKSILEDGKKATATVIFAKKTMSQNTSKWREERVLMWVKFIIKIEHSGYEYPFERSLLAVPWPYVSDFKVNNTLPCTVAKYDLKKVLFEFDETCPATEVTFEDSLF